MDRVDQQQRPHRHIRLQQRYGQHSLRAGQGDEIIGQDGAVLHLVDGVRTPIAQRARWQQDCVAARDAVALEMLSAAPARRRADQRITVGQPEVRPLHIENAQTLFAQQVQDARAVKLGADRQAEPAQAGERSDALRLNSVAFSSTTPNCWPMLVSRRRRSSSSGTSAGWQTVSSPFSAPCASGTLRKPHPSASPAHTSCGPTTRPSRAVSTSDSP